MNILFVMQSPEYLRYYDSTILMLAERGHTVFLAVNKLNARKRVRLESFAGANERIVVAGVVPRRTDAWGPLAKGLRGTIDYVRFLDSRFANAPLLRERMRRKALPAMFRFLARIRSLSWLQIRMLLQCLITLERAIPSSRIVEGFIAPTRPDVLLVSPLVDAASDQVDLVKSGKAMGVRTGACIASWDNLTNKGLIRLQPDVVFVWNAIQASEAVEFHGIPPSKVTVTGAQPFDRWFGKEPSRTRETFCRMVGVPVEKPFVLFVGSSAFISTPGGEVEFVRQWIRSLRASDDPSVSDLGVLIRPHPYNFGQWESTDLSDLGDVAVWPRQRYDPVDEVNRADYFDSMFHSAAVVGINTSAMIEAAIAGRPVHSIMGPGSNGNQEGTLHFHYLLPENGGFLRVAASLEEHVRQLPGTIRGEDGVQERTTAFLKSFVRPYGLDTPCTPILVDAIERLGLMGPIRPERVPIRLLPLRAFLWLIALAGTLTEWGPVSRATRRILKTTRKSVATGKEQIAKSAGKVQSTGLRSDISHELNR